MFDNDIHAVFRNLLLYLKLFLCCSTIHLSHFHLLVEMKLLLKLKEGKFLMALPGFLEWSSIESAEQIV